MCNCVTFTLCNFRGRDSNKFTISVNVAANTTVKFSLTYQELLRRKLSLYDEVIYLQPGQIVSDLKVDIFITESKKISQLNPPFLQNEDKVKCKYNFAHVGYVCACVCMYVSSVEKNPECQNLSGQNLGWSKVCHHYWPMKQTRQFIKRNVKYYGPGIHMTWHLNLVISVEHPGAAFSR